MTYVCDCGTPMDLKAVLDTKRTEQVGMSAHFSTACPNCAAWAELKLHNGRFEVGYSYFGGAMHFESVHTVRVRGLRIVAKEPDDLDVVLDDREWHFAIRQEEVHRYIVFNNAFVSGKKIADIDFQQWNVCIVGIEREEVRLPVSADFVVTGGDFFVLKGLHPALVKAWHYMNDGKRPTKPGARHQPSS